MKDSYQIRAMQKGEISLAISWAKLEGWNPGLNDAHCFYLADPNGFFAGVLTGKIIAVNSAVVYDENFAFWGLYIVDPKFRGQGYGSKLAKYSAEYMGERNCGLDGVVAMQDSYRRMGYKLAHRNIRYRLAPVPGKKARTISESPEFKPANTLNLEKLCAYDKLHFPAARTAFLEAWLNQKNAKSLALVVENEIQGYAVLRRCCQGYKIGPLFANSFEIAEELFLRLSQEVSGEEVFLDLPESNHSAIKLAKKYNLEKVFETARMYTKAEPELKIEQIYGITSFELG